MFLSIATSEWSVSLWVSEVLVRLWNINARGSRRIRLRPIWGT